MESSSKGRRQHNLIGRGYTSVFFRNVASNVLGPFCGLFNALRKESSSKAFWYHSVSSVRWWKLFCWEFASLSKILSLGGKMPQIEIRIWNNWSFNGLENVQYFFLETLKYFHTRTTLVCQPDEVLGPPWHPTSESVPVPRHCPWCCVWPGSISAVVLYQVQQRNWQWP